MSSEARRNSLADAFGVDADELRREVEETQHPASAPAKSKPRTPRTTEVEAPVEMSPGIVQIGAHEYVVMPDGRYEPAGNQVQLNFTVTAKERHLLKQLAHNERRTLVSYVREILEGRGLL